eukprot:Selendium_serpulae@DN2794_c0_g1_i1.p1
MYERDVRTLLLMGVDSEAAKQRFENSTFRMEGLITDMRSVAKAAEKNGFQHAAVFKKIGDSQLTLRLLNEEKEAIDRRRRPSDKRHSSVDDGDWDNMFQRNELYGRKVRYGTDQIKESRKLCHETEQIGEEITSNLFHQREQIHSIKAKLGESERHIDQADATTRGMHGWKEKMMNIASTLLDCKNCCTSQCPGELFNQISELTPNS